MSSMRQKNLFNSAILVVLFSVLLISIILPLDRAEAQESGKNELSLFLGNMLPNQIKGVTEILPVFGARYAYSFGSTYFETGLKNTHAEGVDFTTFEGSFRGDVLLDPGVVGTFYLGLDFNWYIPEGQTSRITETGLHFGAGGKLMVTEALWLRSDLKMMGGPGTALYLLFGLSFRNAAGN